ncbi:hypothetical protein COOONC_08671 [Cooperia oncophora]
MDGTCNNLQNPLRGSGLSSLHPPSAYCLRQWPLRTRSIMTHLRPSPRAVTRHLTSSHASVVSEDYNAMVMQFGQFISHDMAKLTSMRPPFMALPLLIWPSSEKEELVS